MDAALDVIEKYRAIQDARPYRKRFIPVEDVAADPCFYGFSFDSVKSTAKQREFIRDKSKIVALIAANRCGKTEAGAIKALDICRRSEKPGIFWIITESYDLQVSGVKVKIDDYLKSSDVSDRQMATPKAYKSITLKNGVMIEFKTFEQGARKLQSAKLIGAWIDEEPPEAIFDEVYTRTVDLSGQIVLTFTPLKGRTWSYHRLFSSNAPQISLYKWGMADNPFIPRTEIEFLRSILSKKKARTRLDGEYVSAEGAVFDMFDRETHMRKLEYDPRLPAFVCVDWGVRFTDVGFYQYNRAIDEHYLNDHFRLEGAGYQKVLNHIKIKPYNIESYFCDPAGSARSQSTRFGVSLVAMIRDEFHIEFKYIKKLGIEESIEIVDSYMMNGDGKPRFFINSPLIEVAGYIENYVRDDKTNEAIKDGVNDHFCDQMRYYFSNMMRREGRSGWAQR